MYNAFSAPLRWAKACLSLVLGPLARPPLAESVASWPLQIKRASCASSSLCVVAVLWAFLCVFGQGVEVVIKGRKSKCY